jgi:pentatricopeptide repeat protein
VNTMLTTHVRSGHVAAAEELFAAMPATDMV